jgi:two-component system, sporulation sensor kinase E
MMNNTIPRILVVDDDENDFFIISDFIHSIPERKFQVDWSYKYDEALQHMSETRYDLYFVDYFLERRTGLDLIEAAIKNNCNEPVVLLTGINNRQVDINAMEAGAVDYLLKTELNTEKLERCIRYSLERGAYLKALKANERKFHSIFEKSKDAIFLADENLFFKEVNNAASDLFKYTREELLGLNLYSLFNSPKAVENLQKQLEEDGKTENLEIELAAKTKERKSYILSVSGETGPGGDTYYQGIIRDITNFKKIEKATRQIERLQSTAMLLRTLTHEVRNPLTNINLSLDYLKSQVNGDSAEFIEIMERNLRRIDLLVTELLNSARPGIVNLQRTSLQSILEKALEPAADRILLKGITLVKDYPEKAVCIMADAEKLETALLNIIVNAIEAMNENSGILHISISDETSYIKLLIKDNGAGISEDNLSKIFEPYFTSKSNGFGLGLATALNIFQSHKAVTDVQSEEGMGTIFCIKFDKI